MGSTQHKTMGYVEENRFEDFFQDAGYTTLKNYLYNYRLRKKNVERELAGVPSALMLEIGSGLSPVMTRTDRIVYSDVSFTAMSRLKRTFGRGYFVVARGEQLPFKDRRFDTAICSEVLEHVPDDQAAVDDMARVLSEDGRIVMTFPHRRAYYAGDDHFAGHYRRYDLKDMVGRLQHAGMRPVAVRKVLGPLEKVTMLIVTTLYRWIMIAKQGATASPPSWIRTVAEFMFDWANRFYLGVVWLDTRIFPRSMATVLLIVARFSDKQKATGECTFNGKSGTGGFI